MDNIEIFEFQCKLSKNYIEFKCYKNEHEAHMENTYIDAGLYKLYFVLLRKSIDELTNKGYNKIVQLVTTEDWNNYLKKDKRWKIKNKNPPNYIIECNIDHALGCISKGLGLN